MSYIISFYYVSLHKQIKLECARAWIKWEMSISKLILNDDLNALVKDNPFCVASAVLEWYKFLL